MSWEAGPSALTLPGKHTRLTAAAEASGDGVCTESLPPEGSGDSLLGSGVAEPAQSWGRGLICAPLLASGLPVSCRDPRTPSERDLWVGGQGRPRDLLEELPGEGSPCGFSISRGAVHPQGCPSSLPTLPNQSSRLVCHPMPVALDNTATGPGERRTQEEPIRHHGQAGLDISSVLEF